MPTREDLLAGRESTTGVLDGARLSSEFGDALAEAAVSLRQIAKALYGMHQALRGGHHDLKDSMAEAFSAGYLFGKTEKLLTALGLEKEAAEVITMADSAFSATNPLAQAKHSISPQELPRLAEQVLKLRGRLQPE